MTLRQRHRTHHRQVEGQPSVDDNGNRKPEDEVRLEPELRTDDLPNSVERHCEHECEVAIQKSTKQERRKSKCQLIHRQRSIESNTYYKHVDLSNKGDGRSDRSAERSKIARCIRDTGGNGSRRTCKGLNCRYVAA